MKPEYFMKNEFITRIFRSRESEVDKILKILHHDSARIAILGAGEIGKTSVALTALHHLDVATK
jgi:hypothetical protein